MAEKLSEFQKEKVRDWSHLHLVNEDEAVLGTETELEHFPKAKKPVPMDILRRAFRIAIDHLMEHSRYYTKLKKLGL